MGRKSAVILVGFLMTFSMFSMGQIVIEEQVRKEEEKEKEKTKRSSEEVHSSDIVFGVNWSQTSRNLSENLGFFGDPLGERANETDLNTWSFYLGINKYLGRHVALEIGLGYFQNGESYRHEESDSLYRYTSVYRYLGMPVKGYFFWGDKMKFLIGIGVIPQMLVGYRHELEWMGTSGALSSETITQRIGYSSFVLSGTFNFGFQFQFWKQGALRIMPEYRVHMTDTYVETNAYNHFGSALGVNVALTLNLK